MGSTFAFGTRFAAPMLALATLATASNAGIASDNLSTLTVNVSGLRSMKGNVLVCVTANPKFFPNCSKDPKSHRARIAARNSGTIRFDGISSGTYAAALMHDENANDKLDMAIMIPREGFGFSRNPTIVTGPPKFKSAAFAVAAGSANQAVKMKYMF
jgi:uncharacterized protein (DUF2141 family)